MAETLLVRTELSSDTVAAGRTLLRGLDSEGQVFDAAFWWLDEDHARWRLVLSSRVLAKLGSLKLYEKVGKVVEKLNLETLIWVGMISIVDHKAPVVEVLRRKLGTAASVDGVRLNDATLDGRRVAGCLLYRLSTRQKLMPHGR